MNLIPVKIGSQVQAEAFSFSTPSTSESDILKNKTARLDFVKLNILVDGCINMIARHISNIDFTVQGNDDWQSYYWKRWYERHCAKFITKLVKTLLIYGEAYADPIVTLDGEGHLVIDKMNLLKNREITTDWDGNLLLRNVIQKNVRNWFTCSLDEEIAPGLKLFEPTANLADLLSSQAYSACAGRIGRLIITDNPASQYKPNTDRIKLVLGEFGKSITNSWYLPGCTVTIDKPGAVNSDMVDAINSNTYLILHHFNMEWTAQAVFGSMGTGTYIGKIKDAYNQGLMSITDIITEALDEMAIKMAAWNGEASTVSWQSAEISDDSVQDTLAALDIITRIETMQKLDPEIKRKIFVDLGLPEPKPVPATPPPTEPVQDDLQDAADTDSIDEWLASKKDILRNKLSSGIEAGREPGSYKIELSGQSKLADGLNLTQAQRKALMLAVDSFNDKMKEIIKNSSSDLAKALELFDQAWQTLQDKLTRITEGGVQIEEVNNG